MNAALFQPVWGYVQAGGLVALVYAFSCVTLRVAGRRIRSHLRPVDLTALLLMTDMLSPSLLLDDKGLGAELVVLATMTACVRITSLVSLRARWRDPSVRRDAVFLEHAAIAPSQELEAGVQPTEVRV